MMRGEIGVESTLGGGSTFRFTVRLGKPLKERGLNPAQQRELQGLRILIVDHNVTSRQILQQEVVSWGMLCGSAENGQLALNVLRSSVARGEAYDIAILDMTMPIINGMEVARAIKADPALAGVTLVMLTTVGQNRETEEVHRAGILACLTKPVRRSQLYSCLLSAAGIHTQGVDSAHFFSP